MENRIKLNINSCIINLNFLNMKKMRFNLMAVLSGLLLIAFVYSCKEKPEEEETKKPVLNTNFKYEVDQNGYTVTFTSLYPSSTTVSWLNVETNTTSTEAVYVVNFTKKGDHKMVFSVMVDGVWLPSDTFVVTTTKDNLAFLNTKAWKALTGGLDANGNPVVKKWRMDLNKDGKCVYFTGPLYFSGYSTPEVKKEEWSYWAFDLTPQQVNDIQAGKITIPVNGVEQKNIFNWSPDYAGNTWLMAANDYGTISFNGVDGIVETEIFGKKEQGTFTFDTATMKITMTNVHFPTDTARLNEPQFLENDLHNVRIFTLSDSAMQVGIKRTYDGYKNGEHPKDPWLLVYNFVCADYTYNPETFTYTQKIKTSFTKENLVGTWKFGEAPVDWINFYTVGSKGTIKEQGLLNNWATQADVATWFASQEQLTAAKAYKYIFNADGTCTLNGVANTYTVSNGVITFGTALTTEFNINWFSLTGNVVKVIDVVDGTNAKVGIWIGYQNETKNEFVAVNLVKE